MASKGYSASAKHAPSRLPADICKLVEYLGKYADRNLSARYRWPIGSTPTTILFPLIAMWRGAAAMISPAFF